MDDDDDDDDKNRRGTMERGKGGRVRENSIVDVWQREGDVFVVV